VPLTATAPTTLRLFRDRDGVRCAVAFSSPGLLAEVLGPQQRWIPLAEPALRALLRPLDVHHLIQDPGMVARPVRPRHGATPLFDAAVRSASASRTEH
jgi:hypothetical protein